MANEINIFSAGDHLTKDQLVRYNLGQMPKEERHAVESHLVDCELCKDALSGMSLLPNYKGIDKIRKDLRKLAMPNTNPMNRVAWRNVIVTAAVLSLLILAVLFYLFFIGNWKKTKPEKEKQLIAPALMIDSSSAKK